MSGMEDNRVIDRTDLETELLKSEGKLLFYCFAERKKYEYEFIV